MVDRDCPYTELVAEEIVANYSQHAPIALCISVAATVPEASTILVAAPRSHNRVLSHFTLFSRASLISYIFHLALVSLLLHEIAVHAFFPISLRLIAPDSVMRLANLLQFSLLTCGLEFGLFHSLFYANLSNGIFLSCFGLHVDTDLFLDMYCPFLPHRHKDAIGLVEVNVDN